MLRKKPVVTLNTVCPCPRNKDSHTIRTHLSQASRQGNRDAIANASDRHKQRSETADWVARSLIAGVTREGALIPNQLPPRQVASLMMTLGYPRDEIKVMLHKLLALEENGR